MMDFDFERPSTVKQACEILGKFEGKAKIIAGGTDLLVNLRSGSRGTQDTRMLVDISGISGLDTIEVKDGQVRLGPMVTHEQVSCSSLLEETASFLPAACRMVGSLQIRNRGTVGGNICNASPSADSVPPLVAMDAKLRLFSGAKGERVMPLCDFITGSYHTALLQDEMITEVFFSVPKGAKTAVVKLGRRKALSIARMSVAVMAVTEGGKVKLLSIVPGAVTPSPMRIKAAEEILLGKSPDANSIDMAARTVAGEMLRLTGKRWSTSYKEPVIQVLVKRALKQALEVK